MAACTYCGSGFLAELCHSARSVTGLTIAVGFPGRNGDPNRGRSKAPGFTLDCRRIASKIDPIASSRGPYATRTLLAPAGGLTQRARERSAFLACVLSFVFGLTI